MTTSPSSLSETTVIMVNGKPVDLSGLSAHDRQGLLIMYGQSDHTPTECTCRKCGRSYTSILGGSMCSPCINAELEAEAERRDDLLVASNADIAGVEAPKFKEADD